MDGREIRGYSILAKGDQPLILNEEEFLVPSQSSDKKYKVSKIDGWTCECEDFKFRKQKCKHIFAVEFLLKLRGKVDNNDTLEFAEEIEPIPKCEFCKSDSVIRNGLVKNQREKKQRFYCKSCKKTFYLDREFDYVRNPKLITLAIDLYFKGLSLRKITDTVNQFFGMKFHHETIRRWIEKFMDAMNEYVNKFTPEVSEAWHTDEQMINIKGKWEWCWNVLDEETRFLIANNITKERTVPEAREVFAKAKENTNTNPEFIITDGLMAYNKAILKEFKSWKVGHTDHVRLESIRNKRINNNEIERFHGTFRERDKTMRGFKAEHSAKNYAENFRTYYNFVRPHQTLKMTPAQASGIDLQLERNRWLDLLRQSLKK